MKKIIVFLGLTLFLTSCLKEEIAISKPQKSNTGSITTTLNLSSDYKHQLYYNLEQNEIVLTAHREAWDLAFETSDDGYRILMNNSRMGGLKIASSTDFSAITSTTNDNWVYDPASANLDSTAIGDWRGKDDIYIFDLGTSLSGGSLGRYKFRVLSVSSTEYTIEYCKLNETTPKQVTITKEKDYNFSLFSLLNDKQVTAENTPKKTDFDVCLRTYTHIYTEDNGEPYLVVGLILNDKNTSVARIETDNYDGVTYQDALAQMYSSAVNAIGFDWKTFSFDTYLYTITPNRVYVVKTQKDQYYKIRFLDFYDELGAKGATKIEIQQLEE
ncbi:MAG TPA: HmuY family protein [Crocinitomicaceae bacterium]|nr:HmuY family protein [Crocinitomicaceae bacterium]